LSLWNDCFGDLPIEQQRELKKTLNEVNKIVGLKKE